MTNSQSGGEIAIKSITLSTDKSQTKAVGPVIFAGLLLIITVPLMQALASAALDSAPGATVKSRSAPAGETLSEHAVEGVTIENLRFNGKRLQSASEARLQVGPHVRDVRFVDVAPSGPAAEPPSVANQNALTLAFQPSHILVIK
jgi:hypothetical protein